MFIFTRARNIEPGRTQEALAGAVELTAKANETIDLTVSTWSQQYAPTGPAIMWTARLEHLAEYETANEQMFASSELLDMAAELEESLTGPMVDHMVEVVAGDLPTTPTPFVASVQATAVNGHLRAAMHWGADLSQKYAAAMNVPTIFGRDLFGYYGSVVWASYFDDVAGYEDVQAKLAADEMLQAMMDEGAHNCVPGAIATVMRRLD